MRDNTTTIADIRLECLRKSCAARGMELPAENVFCARFNDTDSAAEATRALLELPQLPTCIFYPDDIACMGGIDMLRKQGLCVPRDISVVGFDGIQLSQVMWPRLTTYRQDMEAIGRSALRMLLEEIDAAAQPRHDYIPGELLPGETVALV